MQSNNTKFRISGTVIREEEINKNRNEQKNTFIRFRGRNRLDESNEIRTYDTHLYPDTY